MADVSGPWEVIRMNPDDPGRDPLWALVREGMDDPEYVSADEDMARRECEARNRALAGQL
jgi:hypothetical protein